MTESTRSSRDEVDIVGTRTETQLKIENKEHNNYRITKKQKYKFTYTYVGTLIKKTPPSRSEKVNRQNHGQNTNKATISQMPRIQNYYQSLDGKLQ